jgi:hypothetical protein
MERTMWLFIDKNHLRVAMDFWSWKIWIACLIIKSQNGKNYIDSHSKFVIGFQYMMYYEMINSNEESFFW